MHDLGGVEAVARQPNTMVPNTGRQHSMYWECDGAATLMAAWRRGGGAAAEHDSQHGEATQHVLGM